MSGSAISNIGSNIFDGMWCLMCRKKKDEHVGVYLILCGLPPNVCAIDAMFTIKFKEGHQKNTLQKRFAVKGQSWGLSDFLSFADFEKHSQITLTADVRILNEVDLNGNDGKDSELQSKYDVNSVAMKNEANNDGPGIEGEGEGSYTNGNEAELRKQMNAMQVKLDELNKQMSKKKKKGSQEKKADCDMM